MAGISRSALPGMGAAAMAALALSTGCGHTPTPTPTSSTLEMTTWSLVAVDPVSGDVGVAMASCVPSTHADGLAALVPGKGAAAVQAAWDLTNRNRVYEALQEGLSADAVIRRVAHMAADSGLDRRQYGVVTMDGPAVEVAGFTGEGILSRGGDEERPSWAGVMADAGMGVSAQGNTLVSHQVVADGLAAFQRHDAAGRNLMSDRLMRGLEAGSIAGGDVRCNNERFVQTAATTMIVVARGGDEPYATADIGMTDQGTTAAPWLAISVTDSLGGPNPIVELRRRYDAWRKEMLAAGG